MIYLTGDKHGNFSSINKFVKKANPTEEDILIILGDVGVNYYHNKLDDEKKKWLNSFPFTTICLHGNHEYRPSIEEGYNIVEIQQSDYIVGRFYQQEEYEKILFVADGTIITLDGNRCLCLGGAYSVDKYYRLHMQSLGNYNYKWYQDEQTPQALRNDILFLTKSDNHYDYVFSHTCAASNIPTEMFLKNIDQSQVDRSQEDWLEEIKNNITYKKWYCGHWHTNKIVDNTRFLYDDFIELGG